MDTDLLALRLKATSRIMPRVFCSAGSPADKARVLPGLAELARRSVEIYATHGTARFLAARGIAAQVIRKINEGRGENAQTLLAEGRFDLVINIPMKHPDRRMAKDAKIIHALALTHGIPVITDPEVAVSQLARLAKDLVHARLPAGIVDMRSYFASLVHARGGFANHHAHADKAYLITPEYLEVGHIDMQQKWGLYKRLKEGPQYAPEALYARIAHVVRTQIEQGVTHFRTLVDADATIKLRAVEAALAVKKDFAGKIVMEVGTQPLEGVLKRAARQWFEQACERADFVGGLPSKDRPRPGAHLDILMRIAKEQGKRLDVHVDQENNPLERETELLARKTVEHGMEGRVSAVHAISLACKPARRRREIIRMLKDAGMSVIVCPSAALSMRQLARQAPLHNSIAPVVELLEAEVPVVLGTDNISDFFMPFVDGDMWTEVRFLMEACRFYEAERIADIACSTVLFEERLRLAA